MCVGLAALRTNKQDYHYQFSINMTLNSQDLQEFTQIINVKIDYVKGTRSNVISVNDEITSKYEQLRL